MIAHESALSKKVKVDTLEELEIQKALGNDVVMCVHCEDSGYYIFDFNGKDHRCRRCAVGWTKLQWFRHKLLNAPTKLIQNRIHV